MKKLFILLILFTIAVFAGCLTSNEDDGGDNGGWQVYGYVTKSNGSGIPDVSMTLVKSSTTVSTATTGGYGYYVFNDIPNGTYTVIPSKSGYKFTPAEVRNVVVSGDRMVVDTIVGSAY